MGFLAAVLSGILATITFPTIVEGIVFPKLYWLAWFALIPLVTAIRHSGLFKAALLIFIYGVLCNGLTCYWIYTALYINAKYTALVSLSIIGFMAVGLSLMQAAFVFIGLWLAKKIKIPFILSLPSIWTFYECARNYWPMGGYPWSHLAYSQAEWPLLLQSADLFGVYGVVFLIVFINIMIAELLEAVRRKQPIPRQPIIAGVVLMVAFMGYGLIRGSMVKTSLAGASHVTVGLVQPNIRQEAKWQDKTAKRVTQILISRTEQATEQGAQFVIWPESVIPTPLPLTQKEFKQFSHFSVPVLLGVVSYEPTKNRKRPILYNTAVQMAPGGRIAGRQHKQHLVPLGEYVPMEGLFWFLDPVVVRIGDFRTQEVTKLLELNGYPFGVTICYEDLFPEISRQYTNMGATFLVNLTNDAWYRDSSQLNQHLNFSRFRAVENRRSLLRATNTGLTAVIDPTGGISGELPKFVQGLLMDRILPRTAISPYTYLGDKLWMALIIIGIGTTYLSRRLKSKSDNG